MNTLRTRHTVWNDAGQSARTKQWRAALKEAGGNITRAATATGISRSYATRLTRLCGLIEYAETLRIERTGHAKGNPHDGGLTDPPTPSKKP